MRRGIYLLAIGAAVATWLFATVSLALGDWWLECTQDGFTLTGIDCLEAFPGSARAAAAPARWFGLIPLVLIWLGSAGAIVALGLLMWRHDRRASRSSLDRPEHPSAATRR